LLLVVAGPSLSVVMPVRNEAPHLRATVAALVDAVDGSRFDVELVLVDDGSTDGSADAVRAAVDGRLPLRVVPQSAQGRFAARSSGLRAAEGEHVLLLDARVRLAADALRFAGEQVEDGRPVWNAHVQVETDDAFGVFWQLLAELAWRDYFDDPRTTSFGVEDFDRYPKGTTCFLAPRALLVDAFAAFTTHYRDARHANDDTPVLRWLAARERIWVSPQFSCTYVPRTSAGRFLRHAVHRGMVFVDGHGTPESRFFPAVVAFFPVSAALAIAGLRRPALLPAAVVASGVAAAAYGAAAGRSRREVGVLAAVTPLYAAGHAVGMWRGAIELARSLAQR
jgi:glycosyltransferase involved in cell wall biosynthesis